MHTFFINTSGRKPKSYEDIFEIQHETRRLVSLECPLTEWNNDEKGYKACVHKMGELIDNYKNIHNDFNLIIYVDLLAYEFYTSIPMDKHRERYACLKALRSVMKHYIKGTLINELVNCGRMPQEVLIIFEENQLPKDADETTEDGKNLIRSYTRTALGLPSEDELNKIVYNTPTADGEGASFVVLCEDIVSRARSCIGEKVLNTYLNQVDTFVKEAQNYDTSEQPVIKLLDRVIDCSREDDKTVFSVTFVTNRRAGIANKQERTRSNLRLCFYILACVKEKTIFEKGSSGTDERPVVRRFPEIDWKEVATELSAKKSIFQSKYSETQRLSESFSKLELAPPLYAFDNQRFAMDEFGKRGKTFDIVDVEEPEDEERENEDIEHGTVRPRGKKAVTINDERVHSLFSEEEYPCFDYRGDSYDESILRRKAAPEQYIEEAQKLRRHHLDYLHRLKIHISDRLSNYDGRSEENEPALLRKRKVGIGEEDFEDTGRDYRYAKSGKTEETKKLKTVELISETAYTSALMDYMEFCAGRSVAVTDIEEQCNWLVTRVNQIRESLKKIRTVAMGLLGAIIVLYIPFIVLQWQSILENVITAAISLAVPVAALYSVFAVVSAFQRRKYRKVWKEFREKSDEILEENAVAAEKYDRLLSIYIPTLRWVYEYKLDVEFYEDCCKMARAKIEHHIQKLHDRIVAIGNIIEDLESDDSERAQVAEKARNNTNASIDYNVAFCSGETNRNFYSIIDEHFLESVHK